MKTAAAHTLGCKVNQCDTETLLSLMASKGFIIKGFNGPAADIYIVNTCVLTRTGEKKSLQAIRRARKQNPASLVAACGCLAHINAEKALAAGADFAFDARRPDEFFQKVTGPLNAPVLKPPSRTRAFVKIQDGCDRFCSYCIVPYARGPAASRPLSDIINEAENLTGAGAREVVLTGIQTASYGKDRDEVCLPNLIRRISRVEGLARLRLGSLDPWAVDEDFIAAVRESPVVCNHFHVSLQSGCDRTLEGMNRRYTAEEYRKIALRLLEIRPGTALTTDIMAGFPGETEEDFLESLRFAGEMGFSRMHVFEYSPREHTAAASFPGQVPERVKKERSRQMRLLAKKMELNFLEAHIGKRVEVLFETENKDGSAEGHTTNYLMARADGGTANTLGDVEIGGVFRGKLWGKYKKKEGI